VEELSNKWVRLGDNLDKKKKFVRDNAEEFRKLGVAIKDVRDAENLLVNNKEAFISAQIEKAKATAALALSEDTYKEITKKKLELAEVRRNAPTIDKTTVTTVGMGMSGTTATTSQVANPLIEKLDRETKELESKARAYIDVGTSASEEYNRILDRFGIKTAQADNEATHKNKDKAKDELDDSLRLQSEYNRQISALEMDLEQRQIDALNDSFYKRRKQIELNHKIDLAEAKAQGEELLTAKRKVYGDDATLTDAEKSIIADSVKAADEIYQSEIQHLNEDVNAAFREGRLRFADELTVQLADIDNYYQERIRIAKGNQKLIDQLEGDRDYEKTHVSNEYYIR
jgi:hypothetical protein